MLRFFCKLDVNSYQLSAREAVSKEYSVPTMNEDDLFRRWSGKIVSTYNSEDSMRLKLFIAALIVTSCACGKAYGQIEKGDVRIGGSFKLESFENETNSDFGLDLGYLFIDRFEGGVMLGITKKENVDTYGRAGADLLYHFTPERRVVPGLGLSLSRTFGYADIAGVDQNSTLFDAFANVESFVTTDWAVNLRLGYEHWDGDWGNSDGLAARIGFATFFKAGE